jgi:putative lipoprotein
MNMIEGTIWYRERMLPPPGAQVMVTLKDVSPVDAAADEIAVSRFTPQGGTPWEFKLPYDPEKIRPGGRYALCVRIEANGRLLFINTEGIPIFEKDTENRVRVMVSRVSGVRNGPACQPPIKDSTLTGTYWKLTHIGEKPVAPGAGDKALYVMFTSEESRVQGFSGCNQFSGNYTSDGERLKFGPMMSTNMWCEDQMDQEQRFLKALGQTAQLAIRGDRLELLSDKKQRLLDFKAVYPE